MHCLECFNPKLFSSFFIIWVLGRNGQIFEHACHQLNHGAQNQKNEASFSLAPVHEHHDDINAHSTCTDKNFSKPDNRGTRILTSTYCTRY